MTMPTPPPNPREYLWQDYVINSVFKCIQIFFEKTDRLARRASPAQTIESPPLSFAEQKHSAALMRVNHVGEICAQALYLGQSLTARQPHLRQAFAHAAQDEADHLYWCEERIKALGSHKSYLNPFWFAGSLFVGTFAGFAGDRWSLGFLAETENQVFQHLGTHLEKLPANDFKSREIVKQMQVEEASHATTAIALGASHLSPVVKWGMRGAAKMMTTIAYFI